MRRLARCAISTAWLAVLTACSGGLQAPSTNQEIASSVRGAIQRKEEDAQPAPQLTRAALNTVEGSFMEVTLEATGALAYLAVDGVSNDAVPGQVLVWRSQDQVTFAMRQGVLIQTRGLGGDMLSAEVRTVDNVPGPAGGGQRRISVLALDNKAVAFSGACALENLGPARIEIVGLALQTQHKRETCEFSNGTIQNDYWTDSAADIVWQSRQWAGPEIGYIRTRRLTR